MTHKQVCKKIIKQDGNCRGILCGSCPFIYTTKCYKTADGFEYTSETLLQNAKDYLKWSLKK